MTEKKGTSSRGRAHTGGKKHQRNPFSEILFYKDQYVILDTNSYFLYIGKLEDVSEHFIALSDADVHDRRESPSLNERYLLESKKYGPRMNRKRVHVRMDQVVSLSLLDDVIEY